MDAVDDPDSLATYLYNNFLNGSQSGPLAVVVLDSVDLAHFECSSEPWEDLVNAIKSLTQDRKVYISAAPYCETTSLDSVLNDNKDLFDYLWILYYGDYATCKLETNLVESWTKWTSKPGLANTSVFLVLVASSEPTAASYGYIAPEKLKSDVLPSVMESSNFGGVLLWNGYYDTETGYCAEIKDALGTKVCECVCQVPASRRFNSHLAKFA